MYVILLGPPGTGKGTQAKLIAEKLGLAHVSTGDMFRENVAKGTDLGKQAKTYMDRGELVPDEVTIGMLGERVRQPDAQRGAVFDGFPRTLEQAKALDSMLAAQGMSANIALHVTASDDEIVRRLSGRWTCPKCGEIYQQDSRPTSQPGICDNCGGQLGQRDDDKPDVIRSRLEKQRPPAELIDYYRDQGKLAEVDGQQDIATVTPELLAAIGKSTSRAGATS